MKSGQGRARKNGFATDSPLISAVKQVDRKHSTGICEIRHSNPTDAHETQGAMKLFVFFLEHGGVLYDDKGNKLRKTQIFSGISRAIQWVTAPRSVTTVTPIKRGLKSFFLPCLLTVGSPTLLQPLPRLKRGLKGQEGVAIYSTSKGYNRYPD